MSMGCPVCDGKTDCKDSREVDNGVVLRRYRCRACKNDFRTEEKITIKTLRYHPLRNKPRWRTTKQNKPARAFLQHGRPGTPMKTVEVEVKRGLGPIHDEKGRSRYWIRARSEYARWQRVRYAKRLGRHYVRQYHDGVMEKVWVTIHDGGKVIL